MTGHTPELLTVEETAAFLSRTPNAVRLAISRGQIPGVVHLGRRVRVRRDDLRKSLGLLPSTDPRHPLAGK